MMSFPHSDSYNLIHAAPAGSTRKRLLCLTLALVAVACPGALALGHTVRSLASSSNAGPGQSRASVKHDDLLSGVVAEDLQFQAVGNFIAALQPSAASSGNNAHRWGLWVGDPGSTAMTPAQLAAGTIAQWYKPLDWWKEEHDLIMPNPVALPAGAYKVYGDTTAGGPKLMTIDASGSWSLEPGVTIDDVTHHPCKAFRYMGAQGSACAADNEAACIANGSPVEYRVLIVSSQSVVNIGNGTVPLP